MAVTVDGPNPGEFSWSIIVPNTETVSTSRPNSVRISPTFPHPSPALIREVDDGADAIAAGLGFRAYRDLWQLRCDLPNQPSGLSTRSFTPQDLDDFIAVNNRAFHWHPEQGGLTREKVEATMSEPWFSADGFRLLDDNDALIGFCWTKIHRGTEPDLGEIYVIAIDPSRHGQGLGKPMTLAGLEWLAEQGLTVGMLYVESDNDPANATYASIGFRRHHTDRAYVLEQA